MPRNLPKDIDGQWKISCLLCQCSIIAEKCINTPPFSTMSVPLAAQVLSHAVAAGIYTLSTLGRLPKEAESKAAFIDQMDKLFNALNSKSLHSSQPYAHAITSDSCHMDFFLRHLIFSCRARFKHPW